MPQFSFRDQVVRAKRLTRAQTIMLPNGPVEAKAGDWLATDLNSGTQSVWTDSTFRSYFSAANDAGAEAFRAELPTNPETEDSDMTKQDENKDQQDRDVKQGSTQQSTGGKSTDPSRQGDGQDPSRVDSSTDPSRDGNVDEGQRAKPGEEKAVQGGTFSETGTQEGSGATGGTSGHVDSQPGGTQQKTDGQKK